jgi:hypothetical protein
MSVRFFYVDESHDAEKFCLSAIAIKDVDWHTCFELVRDHRVALNKKYGLFLRKEIHAHEFLAGKGHVSPPQIGKWERSRIYHGMLHLVAQLPNVKIINICLPKHGNRDPQMKAWDRLINRIERAMKGFEQHDLLQRKILLARVQNHLAGPVLDELRSTLTNHCTKAVIVADEGREGEIIKAVRRMHVHNPIPSRLGVWGDGQLTHNIKLERIVEDPIFKPSDRSYFLQLADCVAYALLKREVTPTPRCKKYGIQTMFDEVLQSVCHRPAARRDPLGIVRK